MACLPVCNHMMWLDPHWVRCGCAESMNHRCDKVCPCSQHGHGAPNHHLPMIHLHVCPSQLQHNWNVHQLHLCPEAQAGNPALTKPSPNNVNGTLNENGSITE